MRRSLLRGIAALTMTGSLSLFVTAAQPSPAQAQTDSTGGSGSNGPVICPVGDPPPAGGCPGNTCTINTCKSAQNGPTKICACI